jgi:hypothetical protein
MGPPPVTVDDPGIVFPATAQGRQIVVLNVAGHRVLAWPPESAGPDEFPSVCVEIGDHGSPVVHASASRVILVPARTG